MSDWFTASRMMEMNRLAEEQSMKLHHEHIARLELQHNSVETTFRRVPNPSKSLSSQPQKGKNE